MYVTSPYIQQIFVHGDSLQNFIVSIIVAEVGALKKWCRANDVACEDVEAMLKDKKVIAEVTENLKQLAVDNKFNSLEKIRKMTLISKPFSDEDGLLTPTMKIKRSPAVKFFAKEIEAMY